MDGFVNTITGLFKDKNSKVVIWQSPNAFLCGWAVFTILSQFLSSGRWHDHAGHLSFGFLVVWAILELFQGSSFFRQVLGAIVLIASIHSRFR